MTPQQAFAQKEVLEFLRTWRIWVLAIPLLIFAIGGPIFTYFEPIILESALDVYGDGTIEIAIPQPTWIDSYQQWAGILKHVVPVVLLVIAGSSIAGEVTSGTALPILTAGLKRRDFVLIKYAVISAIAFVTITIGTLINWVVGRVIFPEMRFIGVIAIIGVASLLALLLIALAIFASTFMPDALSSIGLEMFIFLLFAVAALWSPARRFSPAGLLSSISDLAQTGSADFLAPAIATILLTIVLLGLAVRIFQRREL